MSAKMSNKSIFFKFLTMYIKKKSNILNVSCSISNRKNGEGVSSKFARKQGSENTCQKCSLLYEKTCTMYYALLSGNALERVQWVHAPADLWDITFCTHRILTDAIS